MASPLLVRLYRTLSLPAPILPLFLFPSLLVSTSKSLHLCYLPRGSYLHSYMLPYPPLCRYPCPSWVYAVSEEPIPCHRYSVTSVRSAARSNSFPVVSAFSWISSRQVTWLPPPQTEFLDIAVPRVCVLIDPHLWFPPQPAASACGKRNDTSGRVKFESAAVEVRKKEGWEELRKMRQRKKEEEQEPVEEREGGWTCLYWLRRRVTELTKAFEPGKGEGAVAVVALFSDDLPRPFYPLFDAILTVPVNMPTAAAISGRRGDVLCVDFEKDVVGAEVKAELREMLKTAVKSAEVEEEQRRGTEQDDALGDEEDQEEEENEGTEGDVKGNGGSDFADGWSGTEILGGKITTLEIDNDSAQEHSPGQCTYSSNSCNTLLLVGSEGSGKTFIGASLPSVVIRSDRNAEVSQSWHVVNMTIVDVVHGVVGQTHKAIHQLFRKAVKNKPAVVFVDDIEELVGGSEGGGEEEGNSGVLCDVLDGLCTCIDRYCSSSSVMFICSSKSKLLLPAPLANRIHKVLTLQPPTPSSCHNRLGQSETEV
eukprot:GHVS01029762.1.p1 GENE.GHVS01029762.1~~GHVS01029762.1.p1  ORF type:complete len:536 (+),score=99.76 GHVS01029762.1:477-2084(+)